MNALFEKGEDFHAEEPPRSLHAPASFGVRWQAKRDAAFWRPVALRNQHAKIGPLTCGSLSPILRLALCIFHTKKPVSSRKFTFQHFGAERQTLNFRTFKP